MSAATPKPLSEEELRLFLDFHHEIRALVYFKDLPDYIILDTQWLSDAFKCIVTAKKFRAANIRNQKSWEEFYHRGKLHKEVLEDIFENEKNILNKHKDYILNVMEKFDIVICPNKSEGSGEKPCYYVPCLIKAEPVQDIYKMFKVPEDARNRSTWLCFKFKFLPPHLKHHLIATLCRKYDIAEVAVPENKKRQIALFKDSAVFELQKTKLRKLLVSTCPNSIQIQVLEFGKGMEKELYKDIADFVKLELENIILKRFKMSNVEFDKKWECGLTKPEFVTGCNDFSGEEITEYFCETCRTPHKFIGEWSEEQNKALSVSQSSEKMQRSDPYIESFSQNTAFSTKVRVSVKRDYSNLSEEPPRKRSLTEFTKEEINFTKMGIVVLNILADASYDLLKPDKPNLRPRSDCDITHLYREHRNLNKHIPSYGWGCPWHIIQNTDIAIGDDIERIRLTRNELQHSRIFQLDDKRFNELCNILSDLLKRFDQHNKPTKLYTDQLNDILAKTVSAEDFGSEIN
ncbi:unnamed protein product [Mytilus edulis]|uniref:COR domain-containing protein n=1 Tax=Mytilus edulis TaxID=6550 RepID=A0A8S3V630_MYTED|nr:unnamed protein product [Mytilus edulis]